MAKSYVNVCTNKATHKHVDLPIEACIIDTLDGKDINVGDLLALVLQLNEKISYLENEHNLLVTKYNALLAAYKSNAAKTAMQLLDVKENN